MDKNSFGRDVFEGQLTPSGVKKLKNWAIKRGATHFGHYFVPIGGKPCAKLAPIELLDERTVVLSEMDGSNFASRLCNLTNAYAYATICNTSPFVLDNVLYLPSHFACPKGALDYFVPLQKACKAVEKQLLRFTSALGYNYSTSCIKLGIEQEYFLIPQNAKSNLQYNNYCALPTSKTIDYWQKVQKQLSRLGIVVESQHNEVAPCQQELTPQFCNATQACWNNHIVMQVLNSIATKEGYNCVFEEKPFPSLSGSGKHLNFSLWADDTNLLQVGNTPTENARFLLLIAAFVNAIASHQQLLQFAVLTPTNCKRLGQKEAPPTTINMCLGQQLHTAVNKITQSSFDVGKDLLKLNKIQRNRTVAVSYQQGRIEWRSVGSNANCALPTTVLLTALASQLSCITNQLLEAKDTAQRAQKILTNTFRSNDKYLFCGNNYKKQNQIPQPLQVAQTLLSSTTVDLFESTLVATKAELLEWKTQFEQSHKLYNKGS